MTRPTRVIEYLGLLLWVVALAVGFRYLVSYELQAGRSTSGPHRWPADAALPRQPERASLVLFAHPRCPCSRATMAELAVIMTRCPNELKTTVCFLAPGDKPEDWTKSGLWQTAAAIPGVDVVADPDGKIAARFGSVTSGQVLLFDREGRRVFSGGITGARGHQGENRGRNLVIALARGELCTDSATPTFGCSLLDPDGALAEVQP